MGVLKVGSTEGLPRLGYRDGFGGVGLSVGASDGLKVGDSVGLSVGINVVGTSEIYMLGERVGRKVVGTNVGKRVGYREGFFVGL